jgi:uncharacterized repeat protein (TIGR03803 family)
MLRSQLQTRTRPRSLTPLLTALLFLAGSALAAQETVIQPFNNANGFDPVSGPVADEAGNLYGTTFTGGKDECGTVYRLSAPAQMGGAWTKTAFYSFHCGADGGLPYGGLIFDKRGNLYGTTTLGGGGSCLGAAARYLNSSVLRRKVTGGLSRSSIRFREAPPTALIPKPPWYSTLKATSMAPPCSVEAPSVAAVVVVPCTS